MQQYLDPYKEQREQAKKRAVFLKKTLGRALELNEFEQVRWWAWEHALSEGWARDEHNHSALAAEVEGVNDP